MLHDVSRLISQARHDKSALGQLMSQYRNYLLVLTQSRIPPALRCRVGASDVVQETLLDVHRDFGQFQGTNEQQLVSWLRKVLARNLADQLRYHGAARRDIRREEPHLESRLDAINQRLLGAMAQVEETPSQHISQREQSVILADAIARLPEDYRDVVIQRNLQQRKFAEIAVAMHRSPDAVRMLWVRAIENLRLELR